MYPLPRAMLTGNCRTYILLLRVNYEEITSQTERLNEKAFWLSRALWGAFFLLVTHVL
ncbi:MAG: hypothetical protein JWL75_312 [Parcubacteria group bacterium]|nr:hypothetical protein [Parcubacteria group bacterium]